MNGFSPDFEDVSLDLTPLIDTVFLLLIFFIMATTFSKPVLEVALAGAETAEVTEKPEEEIVVTIMADGSLRIGESEATRENWLEALRASSPEAVIVFNVDKDAPFSAFVDALDAAKAEGRETVVINAAPSS